MSYPTCETGGVMNNNINVTVQMELGFNGNAARAIRRRPQTRIERAAWWFGKMRSAVDSAVTWSAKPTPPAEQIWFAN